MGSVTLTRNVNHSQFQIRSFNSHRKNSTYKSQSQKKCLFVILSSWLCEQRIKIIRLNEITLTLYKNTSVYLSYQTSWIYLNWFISLCWYLVVKYRFIYVFLRHTFLLRIKAVASAALHEQWFVWCMYLSHK